MKSYTDLEQSKKLAEFLPLKSADCFWDYDPMQKFHRISWFEEGFNKESQLRLNENNVCAWSLAALLSLIKDKCGYFEFVYLKRTSDGRANPLEDVYRLSTDEYDVYEKEEVDACYELIIHLHEQNLL